MTDESETMNTAKGTHTDVAWLVDDFTAQTPGVTGTLLVSADGLTLAGSGDLAGETVEHLAAVVSGIVVLARGAVTLHGKGRMNQTLVDMGTDGGFLCIMTVSEGSALGVLCSSSCDIGLVAYETARLVDRVGPALTPRARAALRQMIFD